MATWPMSIIAFYNIQPRSTPAILIEWCNGIRFTVSVVFSCLVLNMRVWMVELRGHLLEALNLSIGWEKTFSGFCKQFQFEQEQLEMSCKDECNAKYKRRCKQWETLLKVVHFTRALIFKTWNGDMQHDNF